VRQLVWGHPPRAAHVRKGWIRMMRSLAMKTQTVDLDYVFDPRSVAFVGATEGIAKWGFIIFNNLLFGGYEGRLYPVNPGRETVLGMKCYPSVLAIPDDVDLVVFTVPARAVISALDDCAAKGAKAALVISAGYKEMGEEGTLLEAEMVAKADAAGMMLVGPNCEGVGCPAASLFLWMPTHQPKPGPISVVAQSGNILNMLIGHVLNCGFGLAKGVSSGNEAQLKTEDYLSYLAGDTGTEVIVSYIEGVEQGRRFLEQAREATLRKPVVMLKGGRSSTGMRAAMSHTGAMAVAYDIFESACRQAGIVLARTIREAGIMASSFLNRPLPRGKRVGVVTGGGGLGVVAADACSEYGLELPSLSEQTLGKISSYQPDYFVPGNPVDLVAGLNPTVIKPIIETLMRSGEVDAVMFIYIESTRKRSSDEQAAAGGQESQRKGIDIGKFWGEAMRGISMEIGRLNDLAMEVGVPLYITANIDSGRLGKDLGSRSAGLPMLYKEVESCCAAISAMAQYHEYRRHT